MVPFYMKQSGTLDNACGVIACMHAILNNDVPIVPGSILAKHKAATAAMTPMERCTALENNTEFKQAHSSSAGSGQSSMPSEQSGVKHHFVAFVAKDGKLIELDGTKKGPNVIGNCEKDVLRDSIKEIQRRLAAGEISDSLSMMTLNAAAQ